MKPWERKLYDWGLLGYLVKDVIGAHQEESFGIRQNHSMYLNDWHQLIRKHFAAQEYEIFVRERGWGERVVKTLAVRLDPHRSVWRAARLLGGTLAAVCRKAGDAGASRLAPGTLRDLPALPGLPRRPRARRRRYARAAPPAATRRPTKAASTTCCPPPNAPNSTPATATTSSTFPSPATPAACSRAGTSSKAFSATSTAGSARAPRRA